jgi:hypothetical protein
MASSMQHDTDQRADAAAAVLHPSPETTQHGRHGLSLQPALLRPAIQKWQPRPPFLGLLTWRYQPLMFEGSNRVHCSASASALPSLFSFNRANARLLGGRGDEGGVGWGPVLVCWPGASHRVGG